jgi:hypothetical protein
MSVRPLAALLALLLVALGGCMGKGGPAPAVSPGGGAHQDHAAGLLPPTLQVGDWWNFTTPGGALSYVVSAEGADDYTMDTDDAGLAFFNALSDVSTLGSIRKADLAGSQGKERVQFFQWPLTDGKNWTTTWDGLRIHIAAKVSAEAAQLTAKRENGTLFATYSYSNRTRWLTAIDFKDERGESGFAMKLQASGSAFPGTLKRYTLAKVLEVASPAPQAQTFTVPGGVTDVWLSYAATCTGNGDLTVALGPNPPVETAPQPGLPSRGFTDREPCPKAIVFQGPIGGPRGGGDGWGLLVASSDNPAAHDMALQMTAYFRTLTTFQAGKAP